MMKLTASYHAKVCAAHGITYAPYVGPIPINKKRAEWMKVQLLITLLDKIPEGANVIWLDADAIWADPTHNLFNAFEEYDITELGMVKAYYAKKWRYNTGVIFIKNTANVREFLARCYEMGPGIGLMAHDEGRINLEIAVGKPIISCKPVRTEYNSCKYNLVVTNGIHAEVNVPAMAPKAYVMAWHGTPRPTAIKRMKEQMLRLKGLHPQYA